MTFLTLNSLPAAAAPPLAGLHRVARGEASPLGSTRESVNTTVTSHYARSSLLTNSRNGRPLHRLLWAFLGRLRCRSPRPGAFRCEAGDCRKEPHGVGFRSAAAATRITPGRTSILQETRVIFRSLRCVIARVRREFGGNGLGRVFSKLEAV